MSESLSGVSYCQPLVALSNSVTVLLKNTFTVVALKTIDCAHGAHSEILFGFHVDTLGPRWAYLPARFPLLNRGHVVTGPGPAWARTEAAKICAC